MATFLSYNVPSGELATTATLAGASSSEIVLGVNCLFAFSVTSATAGASLNIRFGQPGMPAAAATDFQVPAGQVVLFDTGLAFTSVRVFGTGTYSIQKLTRA